MEYKFTESLIDGLIKSRLNRFISRNISQNVTAHKKTDWFFCVNIDNNQLLLYILTRL
jgi:hypothetical protein